MLKTIALGIAAGIVLAGPALAQPLPRAAPAAAPELLLVKHDKDKDGPGRKLGHYKHRGGDRGWSSSTRTYYVPVPVYPPGYGSPMPPAYFAPPGFYGTPY
jgi:hypothetical protein